MEAKCPRTLSTGRLRNVSSLLQFFRQATKILRHDPDGERHREDQICDDEALPRVEQTQSLEHDEQTREHGDRWKHGHRQDEVKHRPFITKMQATDRLSAQTS